MYRITIVLIALLFTGQIFSQATINLPSDRALIHQPKYCLFYDNHTMPACPDVGANFDVEKFTDRLKQCGVDYLTFHARCNLGMAYYDTKIGIKHPSLKYDLFGELASACQRKGIALTAYINGGISSAEGLLHRDWTTLAFDGREYREPRFTPYVRTMCYNSPYRDHLIAMAKEIAENYPVSGFFIDCLQRFNCVCPICVSEMKERGIDYNDLNEVGKFSEFSALRLAEDIYKAVTEIKPGLLIYHNNPGYEEQAKFSTYFEVECLPSGGWGYDYLPVLAHYVRTLGNMPVLNMTGRFYDWGDFGGLRPETAIKSELLYGLANGMRPNIGGHFHPRGDMEYPILDRIENIYKELQTMEPWFDNAKNITEIAVVYPASIGNIRGDRQLRSVVRILDELKMQFNVVTTFSDWSKYDILVFPDNILFTEEITKRVKEHIAAGKAVIASGSSGLNTKKTSFALEKEWGVKYEKENEFDPAYFVVDKKYGKNLPDMPLSLYSSGIDIKPLPGTVTAASLVKPYYNRGWDGEYAFYYNPPDRVTDKPALTINNKVAHFSHRIFSGYSEKASVELRTIFSNVLEEFLPRPLIRYENLPSFSRVFLTEQPGRRMMHILSYVPELRGPSTSMIEDAVEVNNVKIALRSDGKAPRKVYLAPSRKNLAFKIKDGYIYVDIPVSKGYSLLVFEN